MSNPTITCAQCGETFQSDWSDEEAQQERAINFPNLSDEDACIVCDPCYKTAMGQREPATEAAQ